MIDISIEIEQATLDKVQEAMSGIKNGYAKVLVTSINKTLTTVKVQTAARIWNEVNLKSARIKRDLTVVRAKYAQPTGKLIAKGEPVGLINFGAEQEKTGVAVKVLRSGNRALLKHAFIAEGKGDTTKEHVFWRKYDGPRNYTPKWMSLRLKMFPYAALPEKFRTPLERLTGPRIEDIMAKDEVLDPITIQANHIFLLNVDKQIDDVLRRFQNG